jgi:type IV pilus assembly protein PilX
LPAFRDAGARQRGVVLFVVLVLLLILSYLGLTAMQESTAEERMSGNLRDRNVALQAAELALRDAERDLGGLLADGITVCPAGSTVSGVTCRPVGERSSSPDPNQQLAFWAWGPALRQTWTPQCTYGQCLSSDMVSANAPVWDDTRANWTPQPGSTGTNPTIQYGTYTGAQPIVGVAAQPRYILEIFPASPFDVYGTGGTERVVFRITARAVGQNPNTVVVLQSVAVAD